LARVSGQMDRISMQSLVIITSVIFEPIVAVVRFKLIKQFLFPVVFDPQFSVESSEISYLFQLQRIGSFHKLIFDGGGSEIIPVRSFIQSRQNSRPARCTDWGSYHGVGEIDTLCCQTIHCRSMG